MKKFILFSLLTVLCLPQTVSAKVIEDYLGEFKIGEAISHDYENEIFQGFIIDNQELVTAIEAVLPAATNSGSKKIFRDGQMLILHDGKTYTVQGVELR